MRFSDASDRFQAVNCLTGMMLKALGMTQLAEPEIQGQPNLSGSKVNTAISGFEFPSPEPMALSALVSQKPGFAPFSGF
jgi:hypothetical protein